MLTSVFPLLFHLPLSKFTADKMSDRLLWAVFRLEMTTSSAAAGDFACPPSTRLRHPKPVPLACTCAALSSARRRDPPSAARASRPFAATVPSAARGRRRGHNGQCFFTDFLKDSLRTVLGRLRLADVDDTSSSTMDVNKFLKSSLATGTTYFFTSGMANRPIRMANATFPPPDPNCRAGPP